MILLRIIEIRPIVHHHQRHRFHPHPHHPRISWNQKMNLTRHHWVMKEKVGTLLRRLLVKMSSRLGGD